MTDATPPPDNVTELRSEDPVMLRPNGTVLCQLGGKRYRLRRPKMGEFRRLREGHQAMNDELSDLLDRAAAEQARLRDRLGELTDRHARGELTDAEQADWQEARLRDRQLGREAAAATEQRRLEWVADVWRVLSQDGRLPDDVDDLEAWLLDPQLAAKLLLHWRTVPFASGAR